MKNVFIYFILLAFVFSCTDDSVEPESITESNNEQSSSDTTSDTTTNDTNSDQTTDNPESTDQKFLKEINFTDEFFGTQKRRIYFYSNNLLVREFKYGRLYYYEYNSNNRISSIKYCDDRDIPEDELGTHACSDLINDRESTFENDQPSSLHLFEGATGAVAYDDRGNLISLEFLPEGSLDNYYYTYDENDQVVYNTVTYYNNGNTYTFEFDGNTNPFYSLWSTYSYLYWYLDLYLYSDTFFKENPLKIYRNNELQFEASYNYDSDGYPITCSFVKYKNDGSTFSSVITFEYVQ